MTWARPRIWVSMRCSTRRPVAVEGAHQLAVLGHRPVGGRFQDGPRLRRGRPPCGPADRRRRPASRPRPSSGSPDTARRDPRCSPRSRHQGTTCGQRPHSSPALPSVDPFGVMHQPLEIEAFRESQRLPDALPLYYSIRPATSFRARPVNRRPQSRLPHRFDLVLGAALAAGNDGARVAHAPPGRGGDAGDEADHRLLERRTFR